MPIFLFLKISQTNTPNKPIAINNIAISIARKTYTFVDIKEINLIFPKAPSILP